MLVTNYTNSKGQLVSEYREEKKGEYLAFLYERMKLKENLPDFQKDFYPRFKIDYKTCDDAVLIEERRKLEKKPRANMKRLFVLYNELTRRKL